MTAVLAARNILGLGRFDPAVVISLSSAVTVSTGASSVDASASTASASATSPDASASHHG